jgi:hypothetical protein
VTVRRNRRQEPELPTKTAADYFKARLGYQNTSANRRCLRCFEMLPDDVFDVPFTPADPLINICRGCVARPQSFERLDAFSARMSR